MKTLEENGVGRSSTYAPIISTIVDRQYVVGGKSSSSPTELGEIVTDLMKKNFSDIVNVEFTAEMEEKLDEVETDTKNWKRLLEDFYGPFEQELERRRRKWSG